MQEYMIMQPNKQSCNQTSNQSPK